MRLRVAPLFMFREDQFAIGHDVEYAGRALNELGFDPCAFADVGRQTGGPGEIVSTNAIGD